MVLPVVALPPPKPPKPPGDVILDNVILGPLIAPSEAKRFYGVRTIVACFCGYVPATPDIDVIQFKYDDSPDQLLPLDEAADAIFWATQKGPVYVHCHAGISRSPSLVIAYIMKYHQPPCGRSMAAALEFVRSKRGCVDPNPGFVIQLKDYERKLNAAVRCRRKRLKRVRSPEVVDFVRKLYKVDRPPPANLFQ